MGTFLVCLILEKILPMYLNIFNHFVARDSAEVSAEASVDLAEASVSAESHFRAFRSFTINHKKLPQKVSTDFPFFTHKR